MPIIVVLAAVARDAILTQLTVAETSNQSSCNKLAKFKARALERCTDNHDSRTNEDSLFTTKPVAKPDGCDRAEEAAQRIAADRDTLDVTGLAGGHAIHWVFSVDLRKVVEE